MQKIIPNLKLTTGGFLEYFVLKILSKRTHSIQEIYDKLKTIGFKTPKGSLYPLFSVFRQQGFVTSGFEEFDSGPAVQKTYCLSEKGQKRLADLHHDWKRLNSIIIDL